jgi:predicted nucleotidyltransferase
MNDFERILNALKSSEVAFVIIGGVAATVHGSARLTTDVDIVYERSRVNIGRLVHALAPLKPYLRGAPAGLPFTFDVETVRRGLNFTLTTDAGPMDVLGEITGIGDYASVFAESEDVSLFGSQYRCIKLEALIVSKRAAGRPKDLKQWQSSSSFATREAAGASPGLAPASTSPKTLSPSAQRATSFPAAEGTHARDGY